MNKRNQPKYNFFDNSKYATNGFKDIIKTETSFKIELIVFLLLVPVMIYFPLELVYKILLFMSLSLVLISEIINSSIERVVDLVTLEKNDLAGRAKDLGSLIVMASIFVAVVTWGAIFYNYFLN